MAINTAQLKIRCAIYLPLFAPFGHPRIIADLARDAERSGWDIAGYAAAGAAWWLESLNPERSSGAAWSFDQLRERVLAGPLGKG